MCVVGRVTHCIARLRNAGAFRLPMQLGSGSGGSRLVRGRRPHSRELCDVRM